MAKVSIAEMQRKSRKQRRKPAAGTAAGARGHVSQSCASAPLSATPEDQRCISSRQKDVVTSACHSE